MSAMTQVTDTANGQPLLSINDLHVSFRSQDGADVEAVRGVDLTINRGESVAIVGESGSGKSTTAMAIIGLLPGTGRVTSGTIDFGGVDLATAGKEQLERIRGREIGLVPQDPMSNLNPVWTVGFQIEEAVRANGLAKGKRDVRKRAIEVLRQAGLDDAERRLRQYPHQFSGGMRQRVLIGIGLAADPKLLIADEPTSALDVTVQRRILDHLAELTEQRGTSVLFITHDLGLAAERAEKLVVMYKGQVVESGPAAEILARPRHPYTRRLVAAAPSLASRRLHADMTATVQSAAASAGGVEGLEALVTDREAAQTSTAEQSLITFEHVTKVYKIRSGGLKATDFTAVDDASFTIAKGTTLALVGESGSGKSTAAKMLLGLEQPTSGTVSFDGRDVTSIGSGDQLSFRRRVQPVFQDPYGSLDPMYSIGTSIAEPLRIHGVGDRSEHQRRVRELLDQVSLPAATANRYPNELSGGQRQRVAVARALALQPEVLVLDEAVSALDVLVQGQVLELLAQLQQDLGLTYLFITHDLAVVRLIADRVCVMQHGRIVEHSTVADVFEQPKQDYTKSLLEAIPGAGFEFGVEV